MHLIRNLAWQGRLQPKRLAMPREGNSSPRFSAGWCTSIPSNKGRRISGQSNVRPTTTWTNTESLNGETPVLRQGTASSIELRNSVTAQSICSAVITAGGAISR